MGENNVANTFILRAQKFLYPSNRLKLYVYLTIATLLIIGTFMVLAAGGTHLSYVHFMYIPIIIGGITFSIPGGLIVAALASLIFGPYFPSNIQLSLEQPLSSWLLRSLFFFGVGTLAGISSQIFRSYIRKLEETFTTDPLTRLPNIAGMDQIFRNQILQNNTPTNIMVIELFYMDEIDQAFGPVGKESLINQVKYRLKSALSSRISIGFIDTKSFALFVPDTLDIQAVLPTCKQELQQSFMINDVPLFVEFHYGISRYPEDGLDLSTLIRKAKIAVAKSERTGRDQAFFDHEESTKLQKNIKILHSLRQSIENKLLGIHYQPKIDIKTNKPIGFEALARWSHPILGRIPPDEFIPLTERTLLINPFTSWVLEESIKQAKEWHDRGFKQSIAVNFSMKNFLDPEITNVVLDMLKKYDFPPEYLEIEITESAIASNISSASDLMHTLRERGVKIAVDDFGTGQSSLQYLFKLPLDVIKIDRAFVSGMNSNAGASAIVKSAIALGHDLNLQVVAEGVETKSEYDTLKKFGCDVIQGYLMAKPMEVHEATDWLYSKLSMRPPASTSKNGI